MRVENRVLGRPKTSSFWYHFSLRQSLFNAELSAASTWVCFNGEKRRLFVCIKLNRTNKYSQFFYKWRFNTASTSPNKFHNSDWACQWRNNFFSRILILLRYFLDLLLSNFQFYLEFSPNEFVWKSLIIALIKFYWSRSGKKTLKKC